MKKKYHKCYSKKLCLACKRIICREEEEKVFVTHLNKHMFCPLTAAEEGECDKCGMYYRSKSCRKRHVAKVPCRKKNFCTACQKSYFKNEGLEHKCNESRMCNYCFVYYDADTRHYCNITLQKPPLEFTPPIASWDIESVVEDNASMCQSCVLKEKAYLESKLKLRSKLGKKEMAEIFCPQHQQETEKRAYHSCNFISVIFENELYGHFDLICFADHEIGYEEDMKLVKDFYVCPKNEYYKPENHGKPIERLKKKPKAREEEPLLKSSKTPFPLFKDEAGVNFILGGRSHFNPSRMKRLPTLVKFACFFINRDFYNQVFLGKSFHFHFLQLNYFFFSSSPQLGPLRYQFTGPGAFRTRNHAFDRFQGEQDIEAARR